MEAIRLVEQGIGTVDDIDKGVQLGFGRKMGPFETGDLVGLDTSCNGLMAIYEERKTPAIILRSYCGGRSKTESWDAKPAGGGTNTSNEFPKTKPGGQKIFFTAP